jgi:hypothetical protein
MKYKTKNLLILIFCLPICLSAQTITISNDSKSDKKDAVVSVKWSEVTAKFKDIDPQNFKVISTATKQEVPFQVDFDGKKEPQNILFQLSINGKSKAELTIEKGKSKPISPKTFARYVPERLDDFAWENDKIAFRAYGKALEGTKGDAYGLDVWVKRTDKLVIDTRYKGDKYHVDNGDGLDYYHVGHTLGAGNIAPMVKDEIIYSKNYHRYKVLENGPLRTSFVLEYDPWKVDGIDVSCTKKFTIDAGSQMYKVEVNYDFAGRDSLELVVGIIKRPEQGSIIMDEKEGFTAYWEPQHGKDGTTGVGVILTTPVTKTSITKEQILTHTTYKKGTTLVYYVGAAWDKAGEITENNKWFSYIKNYKNQALKPMKTKIQ